MEFITLDETNIDKEHICCAISDKKGETCVSSKKAWLKERFQEGLVFKKLDARGKVLIEYMPAQTAWCPILAEDYMHINCFWVSGQFKGKGYANQLLEECIEDARSKGMRGLTILSSPKKMPYLSEPGYLKYKGFTVADTAHPHFQLYYLPFESTAPIPSFRDCAKSGSTGEKGMVLYFTNQCPHTDKYVPIIEEIARQHGQKLSVHKITSMEQAQSAPSPFTTFSFFYDGAFVTNEIMGEKKFEKFLMDRKLW